MKKLTKVIAFLLVSLATWAVTSPIVAQQIARAKSTARAKAPAIAVPSGDSILPSVAGAPTVPIKLGSKDCIAELHLRDGVITVAEGIATAKAHVSLADKREGTSYVWRMRIVGGQQNPLAGRVYDQQVFSMEANGQKEVDFLDVVQVPPGAKRVELGLYRVPPGSDLSFLDDVELSLGLIVTRVVKNFKN